MLSSVFAVLILAVWLFLVIQISWSKRTGWLKNIFAGIAIFVVLGLCYCVPMWLLFLR